MTDRPRGPSVRSYRTSFPATENPISEGGMWLNGRTDGIDWVDVIASNGEVYGAVTRMAVAERRVEQGNLEAGAARAAPRGGLRRPDGRAAGKWGRNQHGKGRGIQPEPDRRYFQEVEIRLRSTIRRTAAPGTRCSSGASRPRTATPRSCAGTGG